MPGFDRSGPMGAGPMTGGGRGLCGGPARAANMPLYDRGYGHGRGMAFRRGCGKGWGRGAGPAFGGYGTPRAGGFGYPVSKEAEIEKLRTNAEAMRGSLEAIQSRIAELEKEGDE